MTLHRSVSLLAMGALVAAMASPVAPQGHHGAAAPVLTVVALAIVAIQLAAGVWAWSRHPVSSRLAALSRQGEVASMTLASLLMVLVTVVEGASGSGIA